jgi:hypothetical protein
VSQWATDIHHLTAIAGPPVYYRAGQTNTDRLSKWIACLRYKPVAANAISRSERILKFSMLHGQVSAWSNWTSL